MKLGANSVLFGGYDMETAFRCIKAAGYDGIEVSAIGKMSEHLVIDRWEECAPEVKRLAKEYELELLAMEQPNQDPDVMEKAMQAVQTQAVPTGRQGGFFEAFKAGAQPPEPQAPASAASGPAKTEDFLQAESFAPAVKN